MLIIPREIAANELRVVYEPPKVTWIFLRWKSTAWTVSQRAPGPACYRQSEKGGSQVPLPGLGQRRLFSWTSPSVPALHSPSAAELIPKVNPFPRPAAPVGPAAGTDTAVCPSLLLVMSCAYKQPDAARPLVPKPNPLAYTTPFTDKCM